MSAYCSSLSRILALALRPRRLERALGELRAGVDLALVSRRLAFVGQFNVAVFAHRFQAYVETP